jgi:hypothetical protein
VLVDVSVDPLQEARRVMRETITNKRFTMASLLYSSGE